MNYHNRGGYRNGGGQRGYNQQRPRNNGGYQQRQGGNDQEGDYLPNSGKCWPNPKRRNDNDPHLSGIMNVEIEGRRYTFFVSAWENSHGNFRLSFKPVDGDGQGYPENRSRQNSPQNRGASRGRNDGGGYRPPNGGYNAGPDAYQYDDQPRQNGAMSRARAIPEPQYYDDAPPHDQIPDGPEPGRYEEAPY